MKLNFKKQHFGVVTVVFLVLIIVALIVAFPKTRNGIKDVMNIKSSDELISEAAEAQKTGDKAKAITLYEDALEKDGSNAKVRNDLSILYYENKNYDKSVESWKKAAESNPNDRIALNFLANSYREIGNNEEAIKYYKLAIEAGNTDSAGNLVTIYNLEGKYDESIALLNSLIEKYPDDIILKRLLASTYSKKGDTVKADEILAAIR
ncbi:MAG: tetratricopeptide repeat protein [Patescibacteria group bacterium]